MSLSAQTIQRTAEVVMFGALCFAAADIVWSRLETHPMFSPAPLASAAAAAAVPVASVQEVLDPAVAPPVPPPPPAPPARVKVPAHVPAAPVAPARPAVAVQPLPVLAGTLVGNGVYLAVIQSGTGTRVVRTGDRVGSYIVNWIGPYKACVKDPQGKKHVLALGVGSPGSTPMRVAYTPPPPAALPAGQGFQSSSAPLPTGGRGQQLLQPLAPPPPPPPPPR